MWPPPMTMASYWLLAELMSDRAFYSGQWLVASGELGTPFGIIVRQWRDDARRGMAAEVSNGRHGVPPLPRGMRKRLETQGLREIEFVSD